MRQIFVNLPVKDLERNPQFISTSTPSKDPDGHIWGLLHMMKQP